jgi:hypothetical protein
VRYGLTDPGSAQFRNVVQMPGYVCGEVNAKNRMGGFNGYRRFYVEDSKNGAAIIDPQDWASSDVKKMFPSVITPDMDTNAFEKVYNPACLGRTGPTDTEILENSLNAE